MNAEEVLKQELGVNAPVVRPMSLGLRMLGPKHRQEVIDALKDPLRFAIEEAPFGRRGIVGALITLRAIWRIFRVCRLYPIPNKGNCKRYNSFVLLDIRDWFFEHLQNMRVPMFWSAWNMFINLYEHAGEYTDVFDIVIEKLVEVYNSGQWAKRREHRPVPKYWRR